ncbi:MAG TPA: PAS domain S-box protein, partial [Gemmatimonadaceae bacterium]|nr:PAS domain S-box protein [Gemmatimonadaceae bacterium]
MSDRFTLSLRSKIAAGLLTALLVLVVGAMSIWTVSRAARSFEEVNHSSRVLRELQKLLAELADVETAARGFAITGDSAFLSPLGAAEASVPVSIARLRRFITDHPTQQVRLDTLESATRDLITESNQIVEYRVESFEKARLMIESSQARLVMDHARALTSVMEEEENRVLSQRAAQQEWDQRLAYLVIGLGGGLAFVLSLLINWAIRADVIEREHQREMIERQTRQLKRQAATLAEQRAEQERLTRRMTALLESTEAGFYGMDTAGYCSFINRAGAAMLGYAVDELTGKQLHETIHFKYRDGRPYPKDECPIYTASQRGISAAAEGEVFWRKDGTPVAVEYSTSPIIEEGQHRGAVVAFADITERIRAQRALEESEERKAAVLRSTLDSIIIMDSSGIVLEFNPAAEKTFGYLREEAIGAHLADLVIPERLRQAHREGLERYVGTGEARVLNQRLELPALRKDGSEFTAELTITRNDIEGEATFTGVLRDISQRKEQESEREQLIKALARSNQELDQFAYVASHDLKAPLRGIANLSQWIEEDLGETLTGENKEQ